MSLAPSDLDHVLEHGGACWSALAGQRLFITGGSGFVGKWLLESLLWANDRLHLGIEVVALTRDPARFRSSAPDLVAHPALTLVAGDACTFGFPRGSFPFVIDAATEAPPSFEREVAGTRRVLDFAAQAGTRRFLFTSSGAIYGRQPSALTHISEDYAGAPSTTDPATAYGQAKRASEFLCTIHGRDSGFDALIARLFAFVGPYLPLNANFAVGNFIRDVFQGGPIQVKGDGTPYRSYLYAADLAVWLWTILVRGESGRPYNVGSDQAITIAELARIVAARLSPDMRIEVAREPIAGGPVQHYVPSVERAKRELGLGAAISLEEGIERTWHWASGNMTTPAMKFATTANTQVQEKETV